MLKKILVVFFGVLTLFFTFHNFLYFPNICNEHGFFNIYNEK